MSSDAEDIRAKVAAAVRHALLGALEDPAAVKRVTEAVLPLVDLPHESGNDRRTRENRQGLQLMKAFGRGRGAAAYAARRLAPDDERERETLRRRFTRLLAKNPDNVRDRPRRGRSLGPHGTKTVRSQQPERPPRSRSG